MWANSELLDACDVCGDDQDSLRRVRHHTTGQDMGRLCQRCRSVLTFVGHDYELLQGFGGWLVHAETHARASASRDEEAAKKAN